MAKSLIPGADDWKKKRGIKTESEAPSLKINGKATSEVAKEVTAKHSAPQKKTAVQSTAERSLPNIKYNFTGTKTQQKPRSLFGDVTGADFAKSGLRRVTDYATAKTRADYDENLRRIGLTRNADKDKLRREAYKLFEQQSRYDMYDFDIQNLSNVSQKLRAFKITKENLKEYENLKKEYEQANARFNVAMAAKQQARERLLRKQEKEADKELKASVTEYLKQGGHFTAQPQKKESPYKSVEVGNKYFDRLMKNFSNDNPLSRINEAQAQADYLDRDYKRRADEITKERTALESEYERLSAGNGTPGEIESFNKRVSDFNGKAAKLESDAALYNEKIKDINENFKTAADSYNRSETEKNRANALTDFIEQSYRERKERAKTNPSESQKLIMSISNGMQMADPNKFGLPVGDFTDSVTELALRRFTQEEKEVYYSTLSTQPDMAEDYFNKILKKHEEEIWSERTKAFEDFAAHGIGGKIGAIALNSLYSMPKTAEDIVYTAKRASGNDMDRNLSKVSESLRRGAARDVKSGFGQLLLDAGFSTGEMLATFLFSGGIGSLASSVAGANAAAKGTRYGSYFIRSMADSMDEVLQRGGTDDQAWTLGILNGAAEVLAECLGTEKWFALLGKPRGTVSRVIKEAVKRAGSEFTEEALTEVAQRISDGFVMGEQSEYSAYIRELMKAGLTEAEANAEAFKEFFIKNPLKAGATGAISAAMTGAGADIRNAAQIYGTGKQISNSPEAMKSLKEAAEGVLKQNYMGRDAEYNKGLQKDISNALEAAANAKGKFGAAWNTGKARAGLAELYNTPKLSINSDTVFSDLRNEERNGAAQFSVVGETEDGRKIYKDNFPPNTPKDIKQEKLISLVQNIWSKQPITLTLNSGDTITAKFNPELSERSDLAKMAFGGRRGTGSEKRMTLGLAPDFYQIATDSKHTGTKAETGKTNPAHDGVYQWEYFVTDLVFEENDGKRIDCHMNIDVKRNANGDYFYSFALEKGTAPRTLRAAVNDSKSPTVPSTNSIRENGEKYNSNFNQNNKWTTKRIAQLDNAVKKSGVNIIIEDIPQAEVEGNKVRQGAYYRNANTIVIDPRVSDVQIANTVLFHELAHSTEGTKYYDEFKNFVKGIKGEEFITETERKMKSLRLSREEAESEAVADFVKDIFRGGTEEMNEFLSKDYTAARELTDNMKNIIDSVKIRFGVEPSSVYERAVRSFEKALAKRETGGEEKAQNKIEYLKDGRSYVTPDREAIFTNNPEKWGEELEAYINDEIRHGRDVKLLADNGDILNITEDTAWKVGDMNGWNEKTFPIKMNMGTHIDELAEISKPNNVKDAGDRSNKRFQPEKFEHRTAYFRDYDNKYYRVHLSVGIDENGKTVYSIGNDIKEQEFPQANGSGSAAEVQRQSRSEGDGLSGATLNTIIRDADGKYNSNFNQEYRDENVKNSTREVSPEEKERLIKEDREREINSGVFFTDGKRRNYNSSMSMWQVHSYEGKAGEEPKDSTGRILGRKKEDKGLTSLIKEISKAYNLPINQGKVVGKNSSAEYHVNRETVRTRNVNDLPVVTHELGHHLDKNFKLVTAVEDAGQINDIVRLAGNRFLRSYSRVFDDLYLNQKKYVRALLKEYGSTTEFEEVWQNIQSLSDTVNEINQRDGAELLGVTREELPARLKQAEENEKAIREAAEFAARSILRNIEIENESGEALKELSGILRNSPVTISRSDASNIADYGSFIKKYVGVLKVKTATEGETGKRSIDSLYQTLRNEMPQYFTKDLQNGGDMLQEIGDVLSMLREERNVSLEDYSQSKEYVDELCKKLYKATAFGTGEARNATLADIENKITELETKRSKTKSEEQAAKMSGRITRLYNELETVKKESVAEFIREYMRDSGAVDKSIKEAIIKAIPKKDLEKLQKYADKTNQYYSEGLLQKLSQSGRHFGESERKETSLNDAIDNAMFNWVDDMWGVKKATDAAEKASGQTLSGKDNPYVLIMNAKNAMGTVERIVKNGMTNLEGDINLGKSLVDILKQTNDINGFEDYLKARRAVTWLTPDKDGKAKRVFADAELNNLWNAKKMVNDLQVKHPEFEKMADEIYNFQNQIIQYFGVEGGLISKETADSMLKKEPNYIPFYRDMSDKHKNARGAHKKAANVLKGASGSTRDILSPIASIIKNVETYVTLAKQQQALRALYNAIEGNEKLGWLAEAVEPDKKVSKIETSPVATQFLKAQDVLNGIMPADDESYGAEVQKFIDLLGQTIIKTEDKRSSSQNNMIPVLMSGEIKWLRVNDEMLLKSLTNINRGEINPVIRIMTAFTNVFKTVSTSANIAFTFGSNIGKDFVHAVFSTDSKGGLPGYAARYGKSLVQEIRKSEDFQRYLNVGGKWASSIVQDRNGFKKLLRDVNAAKSPKLVKAFRYWVLGIFDRMQDVADWVETAPRYTEFRSTYKKSSDIMQALYDSGEITVNFKRSGKKARYVEPFVPYSNAAIQGTRQIAAVTKKHPVRTLARVAAYSTLISIAAAWMRGRKDDKEYENLSSYVKDNFWTVPLGDGEYISVKKPDGFGALCTVIDRAVEGIQYKNPSVFNDIASYIVGQFTPYGILEGLTEGVETAVKEKNGLKGIAAGLKDAGNNFMNGIIILGTMYQLGTNKDFKGSNIVPRKYEDVPPEEQFDENTSWIAKFLGRQLGISPMKIDHAIDSNLGIFAKVNKLTASTDEKDWFLGLDSRYTKSAAYSTDIINNFYDEYDKAVKKKNVSDNPEDLMTYSFYNAERNVIGNLYNIMNEAATAEERKSVKYEMNHYIKALSQPKNEKVDNELKRLSGTEKFKSDILPYVSGDVAIKENGYDRKLSAAEYVKLQKTLNEKMYSSYEKVISSPGYAALSDEDKISALRKVREAVKDRAEFEAFENQDFSYLAKLMKADTLSKENVLYKSRNNTKTAAKYLEAMEPFTGGTLESNTALYAYKNADSYMNYMEKHDLLTSEAAQKMNEYAIKRSKAVTRGDAARFGKVKETAYLFDAESIFEWTVNGNEFGIEPTPEQAYNAYILFDKDLDTALQRAYTNGFYTNKGDRATYTDKYGNKQPAIWQQMPPDKLTEKIGKEKAKVKEKIRSSMQNSGKVNWYETMPDGTVVRHR